MTSPIVPLPPNNLPDEQKIKAIAKELSDLRWERAFIISQITKYYPELTKGLLPGTAPGMDRWFPVITKIGKDQLDAKIAELSNGIDLVVVRISAGDYKQPYHWAGPFENAEAAAKWANEFADKVKVVNSEQSVGIEFQLVQSPSVLINEHPWVKKEDTDAKDNQ